MSKYDLILKGGNVLDPSQGISGTRDVAFVDGRIAKVAEDLPAADGEEVIDVSGKLVTPGLIDLHGHYAYLMEPHGANPDASNMPFGVTTCVDTGSTGWINFPAYRKYIIERVDSRLLAFIHLCGTGANPAQQRMLGIPELEDFRFADPERTARCIEDNSDITLGVKVRVSPDGTTANNAVAALKMARDIADMTKSRVMVHVMESLVPMAQLFEYLRPGDIITHCFTGSFKMPPSLAMHGDTHSILNERGEIQDVVWDAYKMGIIFDTASFLRHFSVPVCKTAIASGLLPTTISSDRSIYGDEYLNMIRKQTGIPELQEYDLLENMTMFRSMGMSVEEVVACVTSNAARVLQKEDLGTLKEGAIGDAAVLDMKEGEFRYPDGLGNETQAHERFIPVMTVKDGKRWTGSSKLDGKATA